MVFSQILIYHHLTQITQSDKGFAKRLDLKNIKVRDYTKLKK